MYKTILYLILLCFIISCDNTKQNNENTISEEFATNARLITTLQKTFEGIELPTFVKSIKGEQAVKLNMETGAEISIPEDAFVDKNGNEIKGDVTIKYKEIKSPSDIIIENVDMTYDSAGVIYPFQTAGMFDLRAYVGNNEVFLKTGKNIELTYVTNKTGNYNLYYYDTKWNYQGVSKGEIPLNANVEPKNGIIPLKPVEVNPDDDLILDIKISHKNLPELSIYKKVIWKYDGDLTNDKVAAILSAPVVKTEVVRGDKKGKYNYNFKNTKGEYSFPVVPVFQPKAFEKAMKSYEASIAQNTGPVQIKRKVNVSSLGLMNYDVIYHRPDAVLAKVDFSIKGNAETKVKGLPLFHITGADDVVVNVGQTNQIYYSEKLNNKIVAIFPDKTVAVMTTAEFLEAVKKRQGGNLKLELRKIDKPINSPGDLDNIISSL